MHPQLHFYDESILHQTAHNHRMKRAPMPKVDFNAPAIERDADYWNSIAQDTLRHQLYKDTLNRNIAKNIILFLGDGMSIPTLTATRIYMGGEDRELSFEKFPFSGLSKVNINQMHIINLCRMPFFFIFIRLTLVFGCS